MGKEIWKDIKGYEGMYQVSNLGNVKSLERFIKRKEHLINRKEKKLSLNKNKNGYLSVQLYNNKTYKRYYVHRLVAFNFVNNIDDKKTVNHINGIKTDNRVKNLEWITLKYNIKHARKNKLINDYGEKSKNSKITEKDVRDIFKLRKFFNQKELGTIFGVSRSNIWLILNKKRWCHLWR